LALHPQLVERWRAPIGGSLAEMMRGNVRENDAAGQFGA